MENTNLRVLTVLIFSALGTLLAPAAITLSYNVTFNYSPAADGWIGDDLSHWASSGFHNTPYLRNTNDGDDRILRPVETGILSTDTQVILTVRARNAGRGIFGITDSSSADSALLGMGGNNQQYFIIMGGVRTDVGAIDAVIDGVTANFSELRLVYDTGSGLAELFVNSSSRGTATNAGIATQLPDADFLFHRTDSRYIGAASYQVDTRAALVPEPSPVALLGLAGFVLLVRRKRKSGKAGTGTVAIPG